MIFFMQGGAVAQAPTNPQFDPMDVFFQAYLSIRAAEQLEKDQDFVEALKKYQKASELLDAVNKFYPDWNIKIIQNRQEMTKKSLAGVREKASKQIQKDQGVIAELEGGMKVGGELIGLADGIVPEAKSILEVNPLKARRLKEAIAEAERLRKMVASAEAQRKEAIDKGQLAEAQRQEAFRKGNEAEAQKLEAETQRKEAMRSGKLAEAQRQEAMNKGQEAEAKKLEAMRQKQQAEVAKLEKLQKEAEAQKQEAMRKGELAEVQKQEAIRKLQEAEVQKLEAMQQREEAEAQKREAFRTTGNADELLRRNQDLASKLKAAENQVSELRAQLVPAPVQNEFNSLNEDIEKLNQEREVMGMALKASRGDRAEALSKLEILKADIEIMQQQAKGLRQNESNLQRDLATERKISNEVVKGQRQQIQKLEKSLEEKSKQLNSAHEQIVGLNNELEQSRAAFSELRNERDGLLLERDQMSALLKLNESGRIKQLIEQNMGLAKSLREANEKVQRLNIDNNSTKDTLSEAKRDLAIAKHQIIRLHHEKREQEKRMADISNKLKAEEKALINGEMNADPEEVVILREVIKRQIRFQVRQRQEIELIVEAARELGKEDERLNEAIKLFDSLEMQLSPEEQSLIADQQVDGEFVSPFARDRETVGRATAELNVELDSYDRAATKAYLAGRYLPTRELFELMIDQHPGHIPALCKLGVVQLKLKEPVDAAASFQKAIELDRENSYANRMLGFSYLEMDDLTMAEKYLQRALELSPDDAKSYLLLGTVYYSLGNSDKAESHFKGAIAADPMPSEPYYNLAVLCEEIGRKKDAREYYRKALDRGAVPDQSLESKIRIN